MHRNSTGKDCFLILRVLYCTASLKVPTQGFCRPWKTWKIVQHQGKPGKLMEFNFCITQNHGKLMENQFS